jgi:hypothetical protein
MSDIVYGSRTFLGGSMAGVRGGDRLLQFQSEAVRRSRQRARSWRVLGAALVAGLVVASPAPALEPLPEADQVDVVQSRGEARESVARPAIAAYSREFKVSEVVAQERLARQVMIANPQALFARELGAENLSAIWFDNSAGEWVVPVVESASSKAAMSLVSKLGLDDAARVEVASLNLRELREAKRRLADRFMRPGISAEFAVSAARLSVRLGDDMSSAQRDEIIAAARATGAEFDVQLRPEKMFEPPTPASCIFPYCSRLVGGVQLDGATGTCTAGFWVGHPGIQYMLTAAHCGGSTGYGSVGTWWSSCNPGPALCRAIGQFTSAYWNEQGDAALLMVNDWGGAWNIDSGWVNWWDTSVTRPTSWDTNNTPYGVMLCKNGRTTGSSCGTVTAQYVDIYGPGRAFIEYDMLQVSRAMCSQRGDSGSPVTRANVAWASGIVTNGNNAGTCEPFDTVAHPIHRALAVFGVVLYG